MSEAMAELNRQIFDGGDESRGVMDLDDFFFFFDASNELNNNTMGICMVIGLSRRPWSTSTVGPFSKVLS